MLLCATLLGETSLPVFSLPIFSTRFPFLEFFSLLRKAVYPTLSDGLERVSYS